MPNNYSVLSPDGGTVAVYEDGKLIRTDATVKGIKPTFGEGFFTKEGDTIALGLPMGGELSTLLNPAGWPGSIIKNF